MARFYGTVVKEGDAVVLRYDGHDFDGAWHEALRSLAGQRIVMTIEPQQTVRTERQNRYLFGPVLDALTDYYNRTRAGIFPVHKSVVFYELKRSLLGIEEDGSVRRSRELSTAEFAKFTDDIRAYLATKGVYVPGPNEWSEES